ncbi:hypothetical protein GBAR_LOCUS22712 [Geodia barretti]|nr:hypothetical protein GBAR_LOCUS22712 [Geodia barretti]
MELGLNSLSVVMAHCPIFLPPHLKQEVCDVVFETLSQSSSLPSNMALGGVRLLRRCLEYPSSTSLPRAVRVLQNLTRHSSSEVCEESRQGLALCSLLLHPVGPPWGSRSGPISEGIPPNQLSVNLMDVQPSTLPTVPPSAPGVNYTAVNGPLQELGETLTQHDSRKRRREGESRCAEEEADVVPASTEDLVGSEGRRRRERGEKRGRERTVEEKAVELFVVVRGGTRRKRGKKARKKRMLCWEVVRARRVEMCVKRVVVEMTERKGQES